jgi:hypothetical protein
MSCLGPNYLVSTTTPWYRRETICNRTINYLNNNLNANDTIYVPILKKYVLISKLDDEFKMFKKGNVLQYAYIHHTNKLTKNQTYALISKGKWISKKGYATQTETFTDPNINYLKRVNYTVINSETGAETTEPITCPAFTPQTPANTLPPNNNTPSVVPNILPPPPPTPSKNKFTLPDIKPVVNTPQNKNIPDGGNLIIGVLEDICSGKTKIVCDYNPIVCFPSSCSNVPRENGVDTELCYTLGSPTYFAKSKINNSSAIDGGQFPTNYKGLLSANSIVSRPI